MTFGISFRSLENVRLPIDGSFGASCRITTREEHGLPED